VRLRVYHRTRYTYPTPAKESHNEARLMPLSDEDQTCLDFRLSTTPPTRVFAYDLPTGRVHHFHLRPPHTELTIHAESLVVTHRRDPFQGLQLATDDSAFYNLEAVRQRYYEYLAPTDRVHLHPETDRIAVVAHKQTGASTASFLIALTRLLYRVLSYTPGATNVNSTIQHVLEHKSGVCQDFAHLMLAICRRQGIPARYVSGYLYTGERRTDNTVTTEESGQEILPLEAGDGAGTIDRSLQSNSGEVSPEAFVGGDAMHAWVECLLPSGEWRGFDPTNNQVTNDYYVKVHYGRDYGDVPPLRGVYRGPFAHSMDVSVRVVREG